MSNIKTQISAGNSIKLSDAAISLKEKLVIGDDNIFIKIESLLADYRYYFDKYIYTKEYTE